MDDKNKTKDNPKARLELQEYCRQPELHLQSANNGKVFKPEASYTFTLEQRRQICECIANLKMPEGYASNMGKLADMVEGKLTHMKSHDYHIFMETLIPIAFCGVPENIWKPIFVLTTSTVICHVLEISPIGTMVEVENVLDVAYQNNTSCVNQKVDDQLENDLEHPQRLLEEVDMEKITIIENEDEESPNENEISEEEEFSDEEG
ncbi:uncharacterized protein [Nicotiana tomentosiformis]|uniref:uncharacterized protein n=1 Tax=Nicotiana tomentosiformis TaxID=4098 RepID=UPI00388CA834